MSAPTAKSFDDASAYDAEIRLLVPGYDLLHALVPHVLTAHLGDTDARILVVGCGTGHELVTLASQSHRWTLDAIDTSPMMARAAARAVAERELEDRVHVRCCDLDEYVWQAPYDAVVALLVSHFIPDDGARAAFMTTVARALRYAGVALVAEIVDDGVLRPAMIRAQLAWSYDAGVSRQRITVMEQRLDSGFIALTRARLREILDAAGLQIQGEFFRALGLAGMVLTKANTTDA